MRAPKTHLADLLKPLAKQLRQQKLEQQQAQKAAALVAAQATDALLFQQAVQDVLPLTLPLPYAHPSTPPPCYPLQRWADEARVMHDAMTDFWPWDSIESGEELLYLRPGQRLDTLKRLRRGHWVVQAELDLHGFSSDEARFEVGRFLHHCAHQNRGCVRIIHGKGRGSKNREPVLKNKLRNWLVQRDEVLAFAQARQVDGGSGAVLVLVKMLR